MATKKTVGYLAKNSRKRKHSTFGWPRAIFQLCSSLLFLSWPVGSFSPLGFSMHPCCALIFGDTYFSSHSSGLFLFLLPTLVLALLFLVGRGECNPGLQPLFSFIYQRLPHGTYISQITRWSQLNYPYSFTSKEFHYFLNTTCSSLVVLFLCKCYLFAGFQICGTIVWCFESTL